MKKYYCKQCPNEISKHTIYKKGICIYCSNKIIESSTYDPFLDIESGQILCKECYKSFKNKEKVNL